MNGRGIPFRTSAIKAFVADVEKTESDTLRYVSIGEYAALFEKRFGGYALISSSEEFFSYPAEVRLKLFLSGREGF